MRGEIRGGKGQQNTPNTVDAVSGVRSDALSASGPSGLRLCRGTLAEIVGIGDEPIDDEDVKRDDDNPYHGRRWKVEEPANGAEPGNKRAIDITERAAAKDIVASIERDRRQQQVQNGPQP